MRSVKGILTRVVLLVLDLAPGERHEDASVPIWSVSLLLLDVWKDGSEAGALDALRRVEIVVRVDRRLLLLKARGQGGEVGVVGAWWRVEGFGLVVEGLVLLVLLEWLLILHLLLLLPIHLLLDPRGLHMTKLTLIAIMAISTLEEAALLYIASIRGGADIDVWKAGLTEGVFDVVGEILLTLLDVSGAE